MLIRFLGLALILAILNPSVALGEDSNSEKRYKRFHYFVYYPIHILGYAIAGPVIIVTSMVQRHDDLLKLEALQDDGD